MSPICVAICTRDRGAAIRTPLAAIFSGTFQDFHVLIIDQSTGSATHDALAEWQDDPRFDYVHSPVPGLSVARNLALHHNRSPLLAFTDDDCLPGPRWLEEFAAFGSAQDEPFVAFGPFIAAAGTGHLGMIPSWSPGRPGPRRAPAVRFCLGGFGGNMLLNRAAIERIGEFNEHLGRGADITAAEEGEYAYRTVLAGGAVWELPSPAVTHLGVVPWPRVSAALRDDYSATGTMLAWQLRAGHASAIVQFGHCLGRELLGVTGNVFQRRQPLGVRRPWWLLRGAAHGLAGGSRAQHAARGSLPGTDPKSPGWTRTR